MATSIPDDAVRVCEAAARAGGRVLVEWIGRFGVRSKGPRDLVTEADLAAQREIRRIVLEAFPEHGFVGEETLPEHDDGDGGGVAGRGLRWLVDPLDGTSNYVHGFPAWCSSVALAAGDEILVGAIHDPIRDECFTAARGGGAFLNGRRIGVSAATTLPDALVAVSFPPHVAADSGPVADFLTVLPRAHSLRRTGSTAINLAWIACGRLDAFWVRRIAAWDVAAGLLILREAGGLVCGFAPGSDPAADIPLDRPAFIAASTRELLAELRELLP